MVLNRVCLKIAFGKLCVTLCGRFCSDEGSVAGYVDRIEAKYAAKWGVQIVGMNFQTHSSTELSLNFFASTVHFSKHHSSRCTDMEHLPHIVLAAHAATLQKINFGDDLKIPRPP